MPFTPADAEKHIKGLSPEKAEQWSSVANSVRDKCIADGGEEIACDATAIRQANGVVGKNNTDTINFEHTQTFNISDVEIFSVGKWNGDEYTEKDLDDMIEAFDKVGFKPPVKLGHNGDQEKELLKDGQPALGWIANIKRVGNKLLADLKEIPRALYDAFKRGNYKTVSSEIYWDYEQGGKTFPRVLRALAFLGADIPAVTDLQSISNLYSDDNGNKYKSYEYETKNNADLIKEQQTPVEETKDGAENLTKGGDKMTTKSNDDVVNDTVKIYKDKITELEGKISEFTVQLNDSNTEKKELKGKIGNLTSEIDTAKQQLKEFVESAEKEKAERRKNDVTEFCDNLVKQARLAPALKTKVSNLLTSCTDEIVHIFTDDKGTKQEVSMFALAKEIFSQGNKIVNFSEVCPQGQQPDNTDDDNAGEVLDKLTKDYMTKHNIKSYEEALETIYKANPELVSRHKAGN
jgi:hypothetical protein